MTIDERFSDVELYVEKLEEVASVMLLQVYEDLAERHIDNEIPSLVDLLEFTYADMQSEVHIDLIDKAVERGDHESYGVTKDEFVRRCYSGIIEDVSTVPYIEQVRLRNAIYEAIEHFQLFFQDGNAFEHIPLQEVW